MILRSRAWLRLTILPCLVVETPPPPSTAIKPQLNPQKKVWSKSFHSTSILKQTIMPSKNSAEIPLSLRHYAKQQASWEAHHPPDSSPSLTSALTITEKERMKRLRAKGSLPFFAKSFARYSNAQKSYDKKKGKSKEGVAKSEERVEEPEERDAQTEDDIEVLRDRIRKLESRSKNWR